MSVPTGSGVEAQAQISGAAPTPGPCPGGDVPREGSRDIQNKGKIISVPYDWCNSTDSPIPYRIWAWQSSASNLANTVRQTDCRSHVLGSIVNQCYGDEPGTGGGIKSGTNLAECTPLSYSPTVRAEGKPMVRYLDKWHMNHENTWGCLNNSEDMGKYDAPKAESIDEKMQASAAGTQVAQAATGTMTDAFPVSGTKPIVLPDAPIGAVGGMVGAGAVATGLGLATGAGLGAQQKLTQGVPAATPGGVTPPYTGAIDFSTPALSVRQPLVVDGVTHWVRISRPQPNCPPCRTILGSYVQAGTVGYRPLDNIDPGKWSHGVLGPHYNLALANQIPAPSCRCQWQPQSFAAKQLPPGAVPIVPFAWWP